MERKIKRSNNYIHSPDVPTATDHTYNNDYLNENLFVYNGQIRYLCLYFFITLRCPTL